MLPTRTQLLRLYKDLLRYGEMLTLTDKKYYKKRIKKEFSNSKHIDEEEEIKILFQLAFQNLIRSRNFLKVFVPHFNPSQSKRTIDRSKVPELNENDLEETFIKGGGPGGQKVNKSNSCVYLFHKPTGLSVKVHEFRDQMQNRKLARQKIIAMLDNLINKEESVENQKKEILKEKSIKSAQKQRKLKEMKTKWKAIISDSS